jgi:hypothetical protein
MAKLYKRRIIDKILKFIDSKECITIYGARQVGKTSILKYLIENHLNNAFYFDLEIPSYLELCNKGPEKVVDYLNQKGAKNKRIFLLIDEIQYLDNPAQFIKLMVDHHPLKLIVSGSSTFEIRKKFKDSLVGRVINYTVYPLDFLEFLNFKGHKYSLREKNEKIINDSLVELAKNFIIYGGYPRIVLEQKNENKEIILSQIIDTYIRKDIRDIGNIRNISSFNKLIQILASQSGSMLNVNEVSNTLGISRDTVNDYIFLLENTFIIKLLTPFHKNIRTELTKQPKVYMIDTGLMHLLWLKEFPSIIHGNSFETYILSEFIKNDIKVNYWRTTNKQEIDFILPEHKISAEAKLSFQKRNSAMKQFCKIYGFKETHISLIGKRQGEYPWELMVRLLNIV